MKFTVLPVSLLALVAICAPSAAFPHLSGSEEEFLHDEWSLKHGDPPNPPPDPPLPIPPPRPLVIWHGLGEHAYINV
jgi:hypothetical protein